MIKNNQNKSLVSLVACLSAFLPSVSFAQDAAATTSDGFIYLSQVPYTGFGDVLRTLGFLLLIAVWSILVVYIVKSEKVKDAFRRMFRNVDEDARLGVEQSSTDGGGYIFDISGNQMLNMNMNPVLEPLTDNFPLQNAVPSDLPTEETDAEKRIRAERGSFIPTNEHGQNNTNGAGDMTTDVNAFVNLIVRGEENPVFEHLRKLKARGVGLSEFAVSAVLELDAAYRAKMEGENNKRNIVLSQIISHWSRPKIEAVMSALLSIVDHSYNDQNVGTKVALMRIMRS